MSFVVINLLLHWHCGTSHRFLSLCLARAHSRFICILVTLALDFYFCIIRARWLLQILCIAIIRYFAKMNTLPIDWANESIFFHFVSFFLASVLTKLTTTEMSQYDYPIHSVGTKTTIIHPITSSSSFLSLWACKKTLRTLGRCCNNVIFNRDSELISIFHRV